MLHNTTELYRSVKYIITMTKIKIQYVSFFIAETNSKRKCKFVKYYLQSAGKIQQSIHHL